MSKPTKVPVSGQIRRSQMITTFGPGAMIDLPLHSVIVGGLEHWTDQGRQPIHEKRLEASIARQLELPEGTRVPMFSPPVDDEDPTSPRAGVTCFVFPAWFVAQVEGVTHRDPGGKPYRTRPLIHWRGLEGGSTYLHNGKQVPVVPVRFVQACRNGHISDIDWYRFVHAGDPPTRARLWIDEGGTGGDLGDIYIRCEATGVRRPLGEAKLTDSRVFGRCRGERPWLGRNANEVCRAQDSEEPEWARLLVRSASNAYFAQVLRVISLPEADEAVRKAVDAVWDILEAAVDNQDDLINLRRKNKPGITRHLGTLKDADIWAEIQRRNHPGLEQDKKIKVAEIETLLACPHEAAHEEEPEDDFFARTRVLDALPPILDGRLERVVLVHKLREVVAQIGFTRFESVMPDIDGELTLGVRRAALSRDPTWVPAVENRGEGIFLAFDNDRLARWQDRKPVTARVRQLAQGFDAWAGARRIDNAVFPGAPYVMLHSLSHLLIQAVALECGYAATAISERIYAGPAGHGILLYTGTPGSEGTLGGLVAVGRRIEHYLQFALELGRLCSNDPICAQHMPADRHEDRPLHGAACHGCLLIGEPSCERRNELLDRALVVSTVDALGAEFFVDP